MNGLIKWKMAFMRPNVNLDIRKMIAKIEMAGIIQKEKRLIII